MRLSSSNELETTWNPSLVGSGDEYAEDFTITGAAMGDLVFVSTGADVFDMQITATVTAKDTVTVVAHSHGVIVDLPGTTVRLAVIPKDVIFGK